MSEVLVPYYDFEAFELAHRLRELSHENIEPLRQRDMGGVVLRYGLNSLVNAHRHIEKGARETLQRKLGHYAIVDDSGDVIGAASLIPNMELRELRCPVPAGLARRVSSFSVVHDDFTHGIYAWTVGGRNNLTKAYKLLRQSVEANTHGNKASLPEGALTLTKGFELPQTEDATFTHIFTTEPDKSHIGFHLAIRGSGLDEAYYGRYDTGERGYKIPPTANLYRRKIKHHKNDTVSVNIP